LTRRFLASLRRRSLVVSIAGVEEVLEGRSMKRRRWRRCRGSRSRAYTSRKRDGARRSSVARRRRPGQNDAWFVATAESINADVVGADSRSIRAFGCAVSSVPLEALMPGAAALLVREHLAASGSLVAS
jgi:hypothetical protein